MQRLICFHIKEHLHSSLESRVWVTLTRLLYIYYLLPAEWAVIRGWWIQYSGGRLYRCSSLLCMCVCVCDGYYSTAEKKNWVVYRSHGSRRRPGGAHIFNAPHGRENKLICRCSARANIYTRNILSKINCNLFQLPKKGHQSHFQFNSLYNW